MFLSIIIPIYNDEKHLNECLDSCLDQNCPKDDYEIICVDDGSTDRTPEMLRDYAEKNANIKLIFKEHGIGNGRTIGYQAAAGDYLWFVDHDDIVAPDAVPELKSFAMEHLDSDRIVFSYYQFFDTLAEDETARMEAGTLRPNDLDRDRYAVVWCEIFKHQFLLEHDILPRSKRIDEAGQYWGISPFNIWGGDTVLNEEFSDKGGKQAILTGRPLYHYRRHQGSESMARSPEYVKKKEAGIYNKALLELYLVIQLKEQYLREREQFGAARQETVIPLVVKLRGTIKQLAGLSSNYWKDGICLIREKDCFFDRRPPEYSFPYSAYIRMKPWRERLLLKSSVEYYLISERAAKLYRSLDAFRSFRDSNAGLLKLKYYITKKVNQTLGKH